jgi:hypothetical protein
MSVVAVPFQRWLYFQPMHFIGFGHSVASSSAILSLELTKPSVPTGTSSKPTHNTKSASRLVERNGMACSPGGQIQHRAT